MPAPTGLVSVEVDQKALDRAIKRIEQYGGKPLERRARKAYLEGARLMVRPIQARITAAGHVQTGRYRRSVKARQPRTRAGELAVASVGPTDPKRHLLIRGHRIVTRGGVDTGRRTQGAPVVDEVYRAMGDRVRRFIDDQVIRIDSGFTSF